MSLEKLGRKLTPPIRLSYLDGGDGHQSVNKSFASGNRELEVTIRRNKKFGDGSLSNTAQQNKDQIITTLKKNKGVLDTTITSLPSWKRLMLSIYTDHYADLEAQDWLPPFKESRQKGILSEKETLYTSDKAALKLFYFRHYDELAKDDFSAVIKTLRSQLTEHLDLWGKKGAKFFVDSRTQTKPLKQALEESYIPASSRFATVVTQIKYLNAIDKCELGDVCPEFEEVERMKEQPSLDNLRLGSSALKILLAKVNKNKGLWPPEWGEWINRFCAEPRHKDNERKWFDWASKSDFKLILKGRVGRDLKTFLDGMQSEITDDGRKNQFTHRREFLLHLLETGKIIDTRLFLNSGESRNINDKLIDNEFVMRTPRATQLALKCEDDIYITEGTYSCRLRVMRGIFPIARFWDTPCSRHSRCNLKFHGSPIEITHDPAGNWKQRFFWELNSKFKLEWENL